MISATLSNQSHLVLSNSIQIWDLENHHHHHLHAPAPAADHSPPARSPDRGPNSPPPAAAAAAATVLLFLAATSTTATTAAATTTHGKLQLHNLPPGLLHAAVLNATTDAFTLRFPTPDCRVTLPPTTTSPPTPPVRLVVSRQSTLCKGRRLVTATNFSTGDVIICEEPYSSTPNKVLGGPTCDGCFATGSLRKCSACRIARYCGSMCQGYFVNKVAPSLSSSDGLHDFVTLKGQWGMVV